MSFYDDASLIMYPSGYKEDKIYSLKPTDGSGDLTFTRASSATRVNAEGLIEEVPYNLLQQSNSFDTTWLSNGTTETSGQSGYDGSSDAWLLQRNDGLARFVYQTVSVSKTSTFSVYAKAGNVDWMYFNNGSGASVYFDLESGAVGSITGGNTASIESVGNGWFRCSVVLTNGSENRIYPAISDGVISGLVGANIYIQDAQLNSGSTAKTYFPTTDRLNVPRIDYTGGGCGKLLLEPQRTNLNTYSESISSWLTERVSVTSNAIASPSGSIDADKIISDTTASTTHQVYVGPFTNTAGNVVLSGYFKKGEYEWIHFGQGAAASKTWFNLNTGQVGVKSSLVDSASITDAGNGWYRCVSVLNITTTSNYIEFGLAVSDGDRVIAGTPPSGGLYGWGIQLEDASTYATSYIPTAGATATRTQDSSSTTGLSSLINSPEGVFYYDCVVEGNDNGCGLTLKNTGSVTDRVDIGFLANLEVRVIYTKSGVNEFISSVTTYAIGQNLKIAIKWALNDLAVWVNGVEVATDTTGINPITAGVLNELVATTSTGSLSLQNLMVFPSVLTDAELETLTTL